MITKENLKDHIKSLKPSEFSEELQDLHAFVAEFTENGTNWIGYSDEDIRQQIDDYFELLNKHLEKSKAPEKKTEKTKEQRETKSSGVVPVDAFAHIKRPAKKEKPIVSKPEEEFEDEPDVELVERIPEEIRFIRRYLSLHGKRKTKDNIRRFVSSIQKAIAEKRIRKTSEYAKEMKYIQDNLVKKYNGMEKPTEVMKLGNQTIAEFKAIIASQKILPSIALIKRYISLNGKFGVKEKAAALMAAMERAAENGKVVKSDTYYKVFNQMYDNLKAYTKNKTQKILSIQPMELSGLQGIISKHNYGINKGTQLTGLSVVSSQDGTSAKIMSLAQAKTAEYQTIGLQDVWLNVIGDACFPIHVMVYGEGGSGKTSCILKLSEYFNSLGHRILYVAGEQFDTPTFTELVTRLNIQGNDDFKIVKDLNTLDLKEFDFVVIDSKDSIGISVDDFRQLKNLYPKQSFIISSQGTKTGDFTGPGQWRNEVDTMIFCEDGVARTDQDKNRWGGKGEIRLFDDNMNLKIAA